MNRIHGARGWEEQDGNLLFRMSQTFYDFLFNMGIDDLSIGFYIKDEDRMFLIHLRCQNKR